jgi:hypothetical protein
VRFDRSRIDDPARAEAIVRTLTACAQPSRIWDDGHVLTVDLDAVSAAMLHRKDLRAIPVAALHVTASPAAADARLAFDGDETTRWVSGRPQAGDEWIRIDLDREHDVAAVRLLLGDATVADYPRELVIESVDGDRVQTLYRGRPLGPLMRGILTDASRPAIDVPLPGNRTRTLRLRQTGHDPTLAWSVHELTLFER